jgi:A/G-specific adenine glycosylase
LVKNGLKLAGKSEPHSRLEGVRLDTTPCDNWIDHPETLQSFRNALILWGQEHFRAFPWRLTHDPYTILLAEVMLHRTQVVQVVPVYQAFITQYPDVLSLVKASQQELQTALSSLGLHWRIGLIYQMVQQIVERFHTQIPQVKADLLSLPGVSEYIAGAVRCFTWNLPEPLIDTNTVRITGRVFGLETKDSSRRNSNFRRLITAMVAPDHPRGYNYALLDLAHLICLKKQEPLCQKCPVLTLCCFGQNRMKTSLMISSGR